MSMVSRRKSLPLFDYSRPIARTRRSAFASVAFACRTSGWFAIMAALDISLSGSRLGLARAVTGTIRRSSDFGRPSRSRNWRSVAAISEHHLLVRPLRSWSTRWVRPPQDIGLSSAARPQLRPLALEGFLGQFDRLLARPELDSFQSKVPVLPFDRQHLSHDLGPELQNVDVGARWDHTTPVGRRPTPGGFDHLNRLGVPGARCGSLRVVM